MRHIRVSLEKPAPLKDLDPINSTKVDLLDKYVHHCVHQLILTEISSSNIDRFLKDLTTTDTIYERAAVIQAIMIRCKQLAPH